MICFRPEEAEASAKAVQGHARQFIMTSTIDVYRKPASTYPYTEAEPLGGLGEYARNKVACEEILWAAQERGDLPLTVIRPGATYGPGHGPVHILGGAYADRLLKGKPIVVHGDGSSFWPSCYADDLAVAFAGAAGNDRAIGRAYHATGEEWVTWDQHHAIVAKAIGAAPPTIVHIPTDALARLAPDRTSWVVDNFQFNNLFDNARARAESRPAACGPARPGHRLRPWAGLAARADRVARLARDRSDVTRFRTTLADNGPWDVVIDMICFRPDEAEASAKAVLVHARRFIMTSTIDVYRKPASAYPYTEVEPLGGLGFRPTVRLLDGAAL